MVVSSVLSMAIRQMRHLAEKPSDFFRLPMFIIVSTFFLMPIRLVGFFRLAHASGWGTRAGAYAGGPMETEADAAQPSAFGSQTPVSPIDAIGTGTGTTPLVAGTAPVGAGAAPVDAGDQRAADRAFDELFGPDATTNSTATVLATRRSAAQAQATVAPAAAKQAPARVRRYNPYAAIPYCIGIAIFVLEAFLIV
jgi:hyaluronan synthase